MMLPIVGQKALASEVMTSAKGGEERSQQDPQQHLPVLSSRNNPPAAGCSAGTTTDTE